MNNRPEIVEIIHFWFDNIFWVFKVSVNFVQKGIRWEFIGGEIVRVVIQLDIMSLSPSFPLIFLRRKTMPT